ncbi:MAG: outer membrane protein assembly factor BamA [Candidatus Omnitrophota bacterium]
MKKITAIAIGIFMAFVISPSFPLSAQPAQEDSSDQAKMEVPNFTFTPPEDSGEDDFLGINIPEEAEDAGAADREEAGTVTENEGIQPAPEPEALPGNLPKAEATIFQGEKIVKAIEVKGNKSIGMAVILAKIKTRVGQPYLQNVISDDLKRLYNTGFFADVSVDRQDYEGGFKVIIELEEKPIIEEITFSQTRFIPHRTILGKMVTQKGKFLDNKVLRDDVKMIEDLYAKKGLTTVKVNVETTFRDETNKAKLHFVINEGVRVRINKINVRGNQAFRGKKIISLIKTRAGSIFNSGYLKEDILEEDMERIKSFYEQQGYIDAQADYETESIGKGRFVVNIRVQEGKRYFIESVALMGNVVLSEQQIRAVITEAVVGKPFSRERLTVDVANVRSLYFDEGYIFANVRESTSLNTETGKVQVRLEIAEGTQAYINQVKIQGNIRTRDIVIRRELRLYPGDRFDGAKLRRSKERLRNLGYFEDISYDMEDTASPDKKDLVVQVKEAKTGSFSFGGGYSTVDQVVGFVEVEQKNFDFTNWPTFTGGGQDLVVRAEMGSTRNNMRLSFTEPWIFDYPISGGFDIYRTERDRERDVGFSYDERRVGGNIRFGKQFTEYVSGIVNYKREDIKIGGFEDEVSADLRAEEGDSTLSVFGLTLTRDSRDSVFSPSKGLLLSGGVDIAGGALGGSKDFYRVQSAASFYQPLFFRSVIEFRIRGGVVDSYGDSLKVPIFERFFAGGARTIRGYNERKVGPIDSVTDDPIGGEALLVGNIEYTIPIIDFLKFATFFDIGNVWSEVEDFGTGDLKSGVGLGLRVKTPIGPINLDYGYPLSDEPGEEKRSGKFYFSVSRGF